MHTGPLFRRYAHDRGEWDVGLHIPEGPAPEQGFAMLVVMDAALHFDAAVAAAKALARRPGKTDVGPTIILGVASGLDWGHDGARREQELLRDGEGHAALGALIAMVIADAAMIAPVDTARRAIMGHSFGALFALDAMAASDLFDSCIAISPSFWRLPALAGDVAQAIGGRDRRIMLVSGGEEPRINADLPAAAASLAESAHLTCVTLPGEDHGSTPFAALPMALRFLHGTVRQSV
jgi:predicted alpha/beta superfamily hydrolase